MVTPADAVLTALAGVETVDDYAKALLGLEVAVAAARSELVRLLQEEGMPWEEITAVVAKSKPGG